METNSIQSNGRSILIIDDEDGIRRSVRGVLEDEGYKVLEAQSGEEGLELLQRGDISAALLDIWLPGMDGIETLTRIRELHPNLAVIMISGHATIATAIKATHLGARDFIEKPLDLEVLMLAINRALTEPNGQQNSQPDSSSVDRQVTSVNDFAALNKIVFSENIALGKVFPQRTLAKSAILYGQGLHSGKKSGLILEPLPAGSGIHFAAVGERAVVPAYLDFVESTGFATTLKVGRVQAGTIEHLMSALYAFGISNLLIKCNGEVPVMDGSARDFCELFEDVGIEEQKGEWRGIKITNPVRVGNDKEFIEIHPCEHFEVEYHLNYPAPVGQQKYTFKLDSVDRYKTEIAPARTFGFVRDISYLQKQGLALGGRFDNFVLIGEDGPINTPFRFNDEPVRHKILDIIGDLFLLGHPLQGRVVASMTGHSDNVALLKAVRQALQAA